MHWLSKLKNHRPSRRRRTRKTKRYQSRRFSVEQLEARILLSATTVDTVSDFNGDGFDDLVVTHPREDVGIAKDAGAVQVLYGTANGISATAGNIQILHQDQPGVRGGAEAGDQFGSSFAIGDFDGDGYHDLAVGVPREDIGSKKDAGIIHVFYGSPNGLSGNRDEIWDQDTRGIKKSAGGGNRFGEVLAAGDFNGDGADDLAVGLSPYANYVQVLYGEPGQGITASDQVWDQSSPGIGGAWEFEDRFGASLAAGDFDNDGADDLAIGAPGESLASGTFSQLYQHGAVHVIYGVNGGHLSASGSQVWTQNKTGRVSEFGDQYGASLAVGDFGRDGSDDLAIGVPGEDIGRIDSAGAVNVLYGRNDVGLRTYGSQMFHQNTPGIAGGAETGDKFGSSLVAGDFDGSGKDDLAIGAPGEDIGRINSAGAVNVIYSSGGRLRSDGNHGLHQNSPGIFGVAERSDRFGGNLLAGDFDNDGSQDLAVGVPGEDGGGAVNIIYGQADGLDGQRDQLWQPNHADIKVDVTANDRLNIIGTSGSESIKVFGDPSSNQIRVENWGIPIFEESGLGDLASQYFSGKAGNDRFETDISVPLEARGGSGSDTLIGTDAVDELFGDDGDDWLDALAGNDRVAGGNGRDRIYGRRGDDYLNGGADNDRVYGEEGTDFLVGGTGNDVLHGGGQAGDILVENAGDLIPVLNGNVLNVTGADGVFELQAAGGWRLNETTSTYEATGLVTLLTDTFFGDLPIGYSTDIRIDTNGVIDWGHDAYTLGNFSLEDTVNNFLASLGLDAVDLHLDHTFSYGIRSGEQIQDLLDTSDATGISTPVKLGQPYLYLTNGTPELSIGDLNVTPSVGSTYVFIIDPTDPYVFVRINDTAFGVSDDGRIPFIPKVKPPNWSGSIDGNLYFQTTVDLKKGFAVDGALVVDLDANDDGVRLGFDDIYGAFTDTERAGDLWETIKNDVSIGVNGRVTVGVSLADTVDLSVPLVGASALYDSQLKEIHFQGESEDPFRGTVLHQIPFLNGSNVNFQFGGSITELDTPTPQFVFDASARAFSNKVSFHADNSGARVAGAFNVLGQTARFNGTIERSGAFSFTAHTHVGKDFNILSKIDVGFHLNFDFRLAGNVRTGSIDLYTRVEVSASATTTGLFGEKYGVAGTVYFSVDVGIDGKLLDADLEVGGSLTLYYGVGSSRLSGSLNLGISNNGLSFSLGSLGTKRISW